MMPMLISGHSQAIWSFLVLKLPRLWFTCMSYGLKGKWYTDTHRKVMDLWVKRNLVSGYEWMEYKVVNSNPIWSENNLPKDTNTHGRARARAHVYVHACWRSAQSASTFFFSRYPFLVDYIIVLVSFNLVCEFYMGFTGSWVSCSKYKIRSCQWINEAYVHSFPYWDKSLLPDIFS